MTKYLHTIIRVSSLEDTIAFFEVLGLREIRRRPDEKGRWRAICSSSCEARTSTEQRDAGSLMGLFADRFRASSRLTPIQDKPPQIAARASPSFSPMPPVKTIKSTPSSAAIIAATCLRTE